MMEWHTIQLAPDVENLFLIIRILSIIGKESTAAISADILMLLEKPKKGSVCIVVRLLSLGNTRLTNSVPYHAAIDIDMASDYKTRVHNYLISRTYYEDMLKKGELSQEDFDEINAKLLAKYHLSNRSIFNAE